MTQHLRKIQRRNSLSVDFLEKSGIIHICLDIIPSSYRRRLRVKPRTCRNSPKQSNCRHVLFTVFVLARTEKKIYLQNSLSNFIKEPSAHLHQSKMAACLVAIKNRPHHRSMPWLIVRFMAFSNVHSFHRTRAVSGPIRKL